MENFPHSAPQSDSIFKISQIINEKDQKLLENEAFIIFSKLEIDKLVAVAKQLNESAEKLEAEAKLFLNETKALDNSIEINRKSLEVESNMYINLKQEVSRAEAELEEQSGRNQAVLREFLEKYKVARSEREMYHPLFNQVKRLQIENLKYEVSYKMLQAEVAGKKKQITKRREIQERIFHTTTVNFAKSTLAYQRTRNLARELDKERDQELKLVHELGDLEILAAQKDKELRQMPRTPMSRDGPSKITESNKPGYHEPCNIHNTELLEQKWNELGNHHFRTPVSAATSMHSSNFNPLDNRVQSEEMLQQIRARCEQRQRMWEKQHSFSSTKKQTFASGNRNFKTPMCNQPPLHGQKRSFPATNLLNQNAQFKIPKGSPMAGHEKFSPTAQQKTQNLKPTPADHAGPPFLTQSGKPNIISVHNIKANKVAGSSSQQPIQKYFSQAISQQTPLPYFAKSTPTESQRLPEEFIKNALTSSIKIGTATATSQGALKNRFKESIDQQISTSENVNEGTMPSLTNIPSQYYSEKVTLPTQLGKPEQVTQESSYINSGSEDPYVTTQPNQSQNAAQALSGGNEVMPSQASSGGNALGSDQSTFSQKYMELQHLLESPVPAPPSPQMMTYAPVQPTVTSQFFNGPGPENNAPETQDRSAEEEPLSAPNISGVSDYLGASGMYYNQEGENNMSFDGEYALSPDYDANIPPTADQQTQPTGFSFNFPPPQPAQSGGMFQFSNKPSTSSSSFFNMF